MIFFVYSFVDVYCKVFFVMFRKMFIEVNGDDKLEYRVFKEFYVLVIIVEVKKKGDCNDLYNENCGRK